MKTKVWNQAADCAAQVVRLGKGKGSDPEIGVNWRYNMAFWGKAMRAHMTVIREKGLEGKVTPEVARRVAKAEEVLARECDGQDCSFKV